MSSLEDVAAADNTTLGPLSLGNLYQSDQVLGLFPHSHRHRISLSGASVSSARPDQDASGYRNIGPAIVLKTYQPKNSSLDSASSTSSKLEDSTQPGDSEKYSLGEPYTHSTDLIYEELDLTHPDQFYPVDGKQMALLQFDEDSLDTQVEQSYRTAATTTSGPALVHADESFQYSNVEATELTNQSQQIGQLDLLTGDMVPLPVSPPPQPQPQTDSSASKLIPSLFHENPIHGTECSEPLLLACVMQSSEPKGVLASELDPTSLLANPSAAASHATSIPPLLTTEVQNELLGLDHGETLADNSAKILLSTEAHIDEKNIHSTSSLLIEPVCHVNSGMSHAEACNTLSDSTRETSQKNSTQLGTCPITSQSEVASKSDDQVTIESTVIQSSRPPSATNPSAYPLANKTPAANLTLDKTDCSSKPTFAVDDLKTSVNAPSVKTNSIPEAPVSDRPFVAVADNEPVSTSLTPEAEGQGGRTSCTGTDILPHNVDMRAGKPAETVEPPEPTSTAQTAPTVQPLPFPAINGVEDSAVSAPEKEPVSVSTLPEVVDPVSNQNVMTEAGEKNVIPESGKDTTSNEVTSEHDILMPMSVIPEAGEKNVIPESGKDTTSNDTTHKHDILTPMSSKQTSRMRSLSGFIKTLNKKQITKADVLNSPGSGSIQSEGDEKSSLAIKALPKRKSLSSLKVKTRFSSFYRSTDEPVPTIPKLLEPSHMSEGEREATLKVEGTITPLKKSAARSPSTPQDQEQPSQAPQATNQVISESDLKANRFTHAYKISRAKRGLKSRSQTIVPRNTSPIDNVEKRFTSVVGELGSTPFSRPKTLRKKRTLQPQVSTPVLKDITLSGLISKLMRKNTQKDGVA